MKTNKNITYRRNFRRRFKKISASTILLLIVGVFLLPHYTYASTINNENIIDITNETRIEQGLGTLNANQLLSKAAFDKAEAIFEEQSFKHTLQDKQFSEWIKDAGYQYRSVGENLAIDFVTSEGAMKAWLLSPSHKKNILNSKFKEIGVAVKSNVFEGKESMLVVQIFGAPMGRINNQENITTNYQKNAVNKNINPIDTSKQREMLLTNSAPQTLLVTNTNSGITNQGNLSYLAKANHLYGQEYLSMEFFEQAVLYVIDYSNIYLMNYYWSIILLLLLVFSSSFVWHRRNI